MNTEVGESLLQIEGGVVSEYKEILSPDALLFVEQLVKRFSGRIYSLLSTRKQRQQAVDAGDIPNFRPETKKLRETEWTIGAIPSDLQNRKVELIGSVKREALIHGLNANPDVFIADFEDGHCPSWRGTLQGQVNLRDAIRGTISYTSADGNNYKLNSPNIPAIKVRPRGLHLAEKHVQYNGHTIPAALFDFGIYFYNNYQALLDRGTAPYFYLPKIRNYHEAKLWTEIFSFSEQYVKIPRGSIKTTLLIENIKSVFEMHEMLFIMRDYVVGLSCGGMDYITSIIVAFQRYHSFLFPEREQLTAYKPFLTSLKMLLIETCHKRGAAALCGTFCDWELEEGSSVTDNSLEKIKLDKERKANWGFDGTWVLNAKHIDITRKALDKVISGDNQLDVMPRFETIKDEEVRDLLADGNINAKDLLLVPKGTITINGLTSAINTALLFLVHWLSERPNTNINHHLDEASAAEVARALLWQWIHFDEAKLVDGREITLELYTTLLDEVLEKAKDKVGRKIFASGRYQEAADLLTSIVTKDECIDYMSVRAYETMKA